MDLPASRLTTSCRHLLQCVAFERSSPESSSSTHAAISEGCPLPPPGQPTNNKTAQLIQLDHRIDNEPRVHVTSS